MAMAMVQYCLKWSQMIPNDPKISTMIQPCTKWSNMFPDCLKLSEWVKKCQKSVQISVNGPKL